MDNTFTLQPDETNGSTDLQDSAVTESGDTGTVVETDTPLQRMDAVTEVNQEPELLEEEEVIERPYKLRSLKDKDLWTMLQILRKMNLKQYTQAFIALATQEKTIHEVGSVVIAELINLFIENIPSAHDEIYTFWSELSEIPTADIEEMEFGTLPLMILDTFNNAKGASFFKVLSKLI